MVKKPTNKNWMKEAFAHANEHPGLFHKQLGIPLGTKIPQILVNAIASKSHPIGTVINNPSDIGYRQFRITRLMKRRAVLRRTSGRINKMHAKVK